VRRQPACADDDTASAPAGEGAIQKPRPVQEGACGCTRRRASGIRALARIVPYNSISYTGFEQGFAHDSLRNDLALQTAVEQDQVVGSSPTLCRLENRIDRAAAVAIHQVLIEQFIVSFAEPPAELILDFDATDDRIHGMQEGRFFHGYSDAFCFLPLSLFCGDQLLVSYLRPSKIDGARHAWAILALLVQR
jgi:hypothetical protein